MSAHPIAPHSYPIRTTPRAPPAPPICTPFLALSAGRAEVRRRLLHHVARLAQPPLPLHHQDGYEFGRPRGPRFGALRRRCHSPAPDQRAGWPAQDVPPGLSNGGTMLPAQGRSCQGKPQLHQRWGSQPPPRQLPPRRSTASPWCCRPPPRRSTASPWCCLLANPVHTFRVMHSLVSHKVLCMFISQIS
jgi:hypothetical protein